MSIADVVAEKLFLVEKYVSVSAAAMYFIEECMREETISKIENW